MAKPCNLGSNLTGISPYLGVATRHEEAWRLKLQFSLLTPLELE